MPGSRTKLKNGGGSGCPYCCDFGFNPNDPAWFYLLKRSGEQQLGITNNFERRMQEHALNDWIEIDKSCPHKGTDVVETERKFKNWLRHEIGIIKGTQENWKISNMEVHSLAELKERSGIETSIF